MSPVALIATIVAVAIVLLVWNKLPAVVVAITGMSACGGQRLIRAAGEESRTRLLIVMMSLAAVLAALGAAAAAGMGISPRLVLISTAIAAAAAFLMPIAAPANAMVMGPGGYTFSEYWKPGLPLLVWLFVVSIFIVPLIWSFWIGHVRTETLFKTRGRGRANNMVEEWIDDVS